MIMILILIFMMVMNHEYQKTINEPKCELVHYTPWLTMIVTETDGLYPNGNLWWWLNQKENFTFYCFSVNNGVDYDVP